MSIMPSIQSFDESPSSFKETLTPEVFMYITMLVIHGITEDIIKHQYCLLCGHPLIQRHEGQVLDPETCWYSKQNGENHPGHYYCKFGPGTLLSPIIKFSKAGIEDLGSAQSIGTKSTIQDIEKPKTQITKTAAEPFLSKELSELPYNIIGNEKHIMMAVTNNDKALITRIDTPGYAKSEVTVVLSKTSFQDFQINVFMDNKLKGPKELSFNISAELYDPQNCSASLDDGLLTLYFPRRPPFGVKNIHITGNSNFGILG